MWGEEVSVGGAGREVCGAAGSPADPIPKSGRNLGDDVAMALDPPWSERGSVVQPAGHKGARSLTHCNICTIVRRTLSL